MNLFLKYLVKTSFMQKKKDVCEYFSLIGRKNTADDNVDAARERIVRIKSKRSPTQPCISLYIWYDLVTKKRRTYDMPCCNFNEEDISNCDPHCVFYNANSKYHKMLNEYKTVENYKSQFWRNKFKQFEK